MLIHISYLISYLIAGKQRIMSSTTTYEYEYEYELPEDVWGIVMSFFHSSYKKPTHYNAIMATKDFYNKTKFVKRDKRENAPLFLSYYAHIIATNWIYWRMPDLLHQPEVSLTRGVARGKIRDEFAAIWKQYKTNQHYHGGAEVKYTYIV